MARPDPKFAQPERKKIQPELSSNLRKFQMNFTEVIFVVFVLILGGIFKKIRPEVKNHQPDIESRST